MPPNQKVRPIERRTKNASLNAATHSPLYNKGREYIFTYSTPLKVEIFKCVAYILYHFTYDLSILLKIKKQGRFDFTQTALVMNLAVGS